MTVITRQFQSAPPSSSIFNGTPDLRDEDCECVEIKQRKGHSYIQHSAGLVLLEAIYPSWKIHMVASLPSVGCDFSYLSIVEFLPYHLRN